MRNSSIRLLLTAALAVATSPAFALTHVGDLVYCDLDANGIYDGADYPLDGVEVQVVCTARDGVECLNTTATTGVLHPSVNPDSFDGVCGQYADYSANGDISGRYLVEIFGIATDAPGGCWPDNPTPYTCHTMVNPDTLPAECAGLVTPLIGSLPADGNSDGDFCDAEDGPFPEGQILGNNGSDPVTCESKPGTPGDGEHTVVSGGADANCLLYADFGYTPLDVPNGATRTPGFWKNHPDALAATLPVEICGETVTEVCDAVENLSAKGSGLNKFLRHATAAALNCDVFGCSEDIAAAIAAGNAACAAGDDHFPYTATGTVLDIFNNSGTNIEAVGLDFGPADPAFCR